jgi:hypothetical protein
MPWFNVGGHNAVQATGLGETSYVTLGIHGYSTQAQAEAHPVNEAQALALTAEGLGETAAQPGNPLNLAAAAPAAEAGIVQPVTNAVPGLSQIGTFFASLGQANTWIRVAEVLLGLALLGVGIAHITKADNVISKAVRTGAKGALLA